MRSAALTFALLVVLAGFAPPVANGAVPPPHASGQTATGGDATRPNLGAPSGVTIGIDLLQNESARWSISLTYSLETRNETAAFRAYGEEFESGDVGGAIDAATFRRIASQASNQTGRHMAIREVNRTATVESAGTVGTLTLAFTWTNFLERVDVNTLRFDDAVMLPDNRTWLSSIEPGQTMVLRTPPGYNINSTQIPPFDLRNNAVVIEGPQEFDGDLSIVYRREQPITPDGGLPWAFIGLLAVAGAILMVGYLLLLRGRRSADDDTASGPESVTDEVAQSAADPSDGDETDTEPADAESDEPPVDLSLLSDEERVEHLLEQSGGRMKQANIVRETGWSDAKVSQLLSSMAEAGRVEKLRLGRENLISLPGQEDGDDEE